MVQIISRKLGPGILWYRRPTTTYYAGDSKGSGNKVNVVLNEKFDGASFEIKLDPNTEESCCDSVFVKVSRVRASWYSAINGKTTKRSDEWRASDTYTSGVGPSGGEFERHPGYRNIWNNISLINPMKSGDSVRFHWKVYFQREWHDGGMSSLTYKK